MKSNIAIVLFVLLAFVGCGKESESVSKITMPDVNDDNCTTRSIEALPSNIQQEFSARCLRRSSYKESGDREW